MSVMPLQKKFSNALGKMPFQSAVVEFAANELVFAVVGPVGSGTSEIAERDAVWDLLNGSDREGPQADVVLTRT